MDGNPVDIERGVVEGGTVSLLTSVAGDFNGDSVDDEATLGDRIKFDFMGIYGPGSVSRLTGVPIHPDDHGQLVVGYYVHGPEQAYAESPGIYISRHWKIDDGKLVSMEDY